MERVTCEYKFLRGAKKDELCGKWVKSYQHHQIPFCHAHKKNYKNFKKKQQPENEDPPSESDQSGMSECQASQQE